MRSEVTMALDLEKRIGTGALNAWEERFVRKQVGRIQSPRSIPLTPKQREMLINLWKEHC